ncbi:PepSY-like domain-containing protein [Ferruginibacter sp. HRS2-29]|uniref:PepSY-like domain-containing protein n=1 Tax=Ferruginibacter sp. HRS2-29 TaxID=2487334 RepID=UPI0020CFDD6B
MKKLIYVLTAALVFGATTSADAQIRKIPAAVTDAFTAKFPEAKSVEWSDKITGFEATFEANSHKQQATFNKKGTWKKTEVTLSTEEIPAAVKDGLAKSKYNDWEDRTYVLVTEDNGKEMYRVYVKKSDLQKKYLYFSKEGVLLKDSITL